MKIRPMNQEEQKYSYSQSMQLRGQTGSIGYLYGDFSSIGQKFSSSFTDHRKQWNTKEFKSELDEVINVLQSEVYGLLGKENMMRKCAGYNPESTFGDDGWGKSGFRADTENYSYLFRFNPTPGDYNFYCYCYVSKWLNFHIENAKTGIRFITPDYTELFKIPDGGKVVITMASGEKQERTCRYIDACHVEIGSEHLHICQFAELMKNIEAVCEPKQAEVQTELFLETSEGVTEQVKITVGAEKSDHSLHIGMYVMNGRIPEPYGDVTVHLNGTVPSYCAYVDTYLMPELEEFLVKNKIAEFTGLTKQRGDVIYPLYLFAGDKLKEQFPSGVAEYEQLNGLEKSEPEKEKGR